ncbi:hypothetical protein GH849_31825 [Bacillus thuringiensis]|nr:hypothetical protein [Bacillus thuringiensis]
MIKVYNEAGRLTRIVKDMETVTATDDTFIGGKVTALVTREYGTIYVKFTDIDPANVDVAFLITMRIDGEKYVPFPTWGIEWEPISEGDLDE